MKSLIYRGRKEDHVLGGGTNELGFGQVVFEAPEGNGGKKSLVGGLKQRSGSWEGDRLVAEN